MEQDRLDHGKLVWVLRNMAGFDVRRDHSLADRELVFDVLAGPFTVFIVVALTQFKKVKFVVSTNVSHGLHYERLELS